VDSNGTRFHLRFGPRDWAEHVAAPGSRAMVFDAESGSVALDQVAQILPGQADGQVLAAGDRRGADCDRFGNWYWIDAGRRRIRTVRSGRADASTYWDADQPHAEPCPADNEPGALFVAVEPASPAFAELRLQGLAVTTGHYLVVGTAAPAGLLVFDLHAYGPPVLLPWPEEVGFRPFDMERIDDGGVWILEEGEGARFWRLDTQLRPIPTGRAIELEPAGVELFRAPGAMPAEYPSVTFPDGFRSGLGSPATVRAPRGIVGLPDGSVLILDTGPAGPSSIVRLHGETLLGTVVLDAPMLDRYLPPPAEIRGHDLAFLPDPGGGTGPETSGRLVVVTEGGNQAFRFRLLADRDTLELTLLPDYLPLRRFGGRALVACEGRVRYDLDERWNALVTMPRRRYRPDGVLEGLVFDGKTPGCVWHRLVFDGCVPPGSSVGVETRAAEDLVALEDGRWNPEPPPYRRGDGPETLPYLPCAGAGESEPGSARGTWETLFQRAEGRFLELRLTFFGGGRLTPQIRALRVYYPRFSYLERYLPATYREGPVSASFLDRFLANPEGIFTVLEDRIAAAEGLFDTRIAPADYLGWLAGWLGASLHPDWEDWRKRHFIDNAALLFRWRGTLPGLRAFLSLAVADRPSRTLLDELRSGSPAIEEQPGRDIRIVESFLLRDFGGVELGGPGAGAGAVAFAAADAAWTPEQGAAPLHQRYREFVLARYGAAGDAAAALAAVAEAWGRPLESESAITLPPTAPAAPAEADDWRAFISGPIGFTYWPATAKDHAAWCAFLERRHGRIGRLSSAWRHAEGAYASFDDVEIPGADDFPAGGQRLADWIDFVSRALPMVGTAHRFTVLVPTEPGESGPQRTDRLERVRALVEREKPAHTLFEVRPFWALFQVGTARLGLDTILGEGARFTAIELGRSALAEGRLAFGHPWSVTDRAVVGRDHSGEYRI
jgi:phage tail-like protein